MTPLVQITSIAIRVYVPLGIQESTVKQVCIQLLIYDVSNACRQCMANIYETLNINLNIERQLGFLAE
jgi:hypothetical protein